MGWGPVSGKKGIKRRRRKSKKESHHQGGVRIGSKRIRRSQLNRNLPILWRHLGSNSSHFIIWTTLVKLFNDSKKYRITNQTLLSHFSSMGDPKERKNAARALGNNKDGPQREQRSWEWRWRQFLVSGGSNMWRPHSRGRGGYPKQQKNIREVA